MTKVAAHAHEVDLGPGSPKPAEIRAQLARILASPAFHGSKRCHQFLEYVVEKSLAGEMGSLKERTIATEVFGRKPHSDLGEDTIVRVGAREVRKRLAQFYVTPEGVASEVRLDLPAGAYAPEFHYREIPKEPESAPSPASAVVPQRRWKTVAIVSGVGIVLAAAIAVAKWPAANPNAVAFDKFWDPVFRSTDPLLVAVAHPIVYHPSNRVSRLSEDRIPATDIPVQQPVQIAPDEMNGSDLIPVLNQYVGFGDLVAATDVSSMLARRAHTVRVRMASGIEFPDLRQTQSLLIGAITNRWTMQLQTAWRFQFRRSDHKTALVDTQATGGQRREWSPSANADGSAPEDYFMVCRIRNSFTGGFLLVAAGLKQFGTEAGGRLLTNPDQLGTILRKLPAGWETKDLQVILHTRVIGNTSAQPEVVAWHVW